MWLDRTVCKENVEQSAIVVFNKEFEKGGRARNETFREYLLNKVIAILPDTKSIDDQKFLLVRSTNGHTYGLHIKRENGKYSGSIYDGHIFTRSDLLHERGDFLVKDLLIYAEEGALRDRPEYKIIKRRM